MAATLVMVTAGSAHAQISSQGTVRGVIRDAEGGVLPGVTVMAVSPTDPGSHTSVSESDGQYRLLNLSPGLFDIVAELARFATFTQRGVDVRAGLNLTDMVTARQGRMETVRLPTDAVADSQVRTGGADASAPAGLGVVFNVTTKVGTNRFSGTAGVHHQNRGWNGDNDPLGVPAIAESSHVEAAVGGPIWREAMSQYREQSDRQSEFRVRAGRHVPRPESPGRSRGSADAAVRVLKKVDYGSRAYSARACFTTGTSGSAFFHSVNRSS